MFNIVNKQVEILTELVIDIRLARALFERVRAIPQKTEEHPSLLYSVSDLDYFINHKRYNTLLENSIFNTDGEMHPIFQEIIEILSASEWYLQVEKPSATKSKKNPNKNYKRIMELFGNNEKIIAIFPPKHLAQKKEIFNVTIKIFNNIDDVVTKIFAKKLEKECAITLVNIVHLNKKSAVEVANSILQRKFNNLLNVSTRDNIPLELLNAISKGFYCERDDSYFFRYYSKKYNLVLGTRVNIGTEYATGFRQYKNGTADLILMPYNQIKNVIWLK